MVQVMVAKEPVKYVVIVIVIPTENLQEMSFDGAFDGRRRCRRRYRRRCHLRHRRHNRCHDNGLEERVLEHVESTCILQCPTYWVSHENVHQNQLAPNF